MKKNPYEVPELKAENLHPDMIPYLNFGSFLYNKEQPKVIIFADPFTKTIFCNFVKNEYTPINQIIYLFMDIIPSYSYIVDYKENLKIDTQTGLLIQQKKVFYEIYKND
jgi:hypothetical protein